MYCVFVDACISFSDLRDRVRRKRTISKATYKINPTKTHIVANGKSKPQSSLTSHSENWIKIIKFVGEHHFFHEGFCSRRFYYYLIIIFSLYCFWLRASNSLTSFLSSEIGSKAISATYLLPMKLQISLWEKAETAQ